VAGGLTVEPAVLQREADPPVLSMVRPRKTLLLASPGNPVCPNPSDSLSPRIVSQLRSRQFAPSTSPHECIPHRAAPLPPGPSPRGVHGGPVGPRVAVPAARHARHAPVRRDRLRPQVARRPPPPRGGGGRLVSAGGGERRLAASPFDRIHPGGGGGGGGQKSGRWGRPYT